MVDLLSMVKIKVVFDMMINVKLIFVKIMGNINLLWG